MCSSVALHTVCGLFTLWTSQCGLFIVWTLHSVQSTVSGARQFFVPSQCLRVWQPKSTSSVHKLGRKSRINFCFYKLSVCMPLWRHRVCERCTGILIARDSIFGAIFGAMFESIFEAIFQTIFEARFDVIFQAIFRLYSGQYSI